MVGLFYPREVRRHVRVMNAILLFLVFVYSMTIFDDKYAFTRINLLLKVMPILSFFFGCIGLELQKSCIVFYSNET